MTALQSILKEAKALRKSFPTRYKNWTDYVKQASAIYASKHKGKSPVGKKHAVKKKAAKKKAVGKVDKKLAKNLASKGLKMPHGYDVVKRKRKISGVKIAGSSDYYTRKKEGRITPRKSTKKAVKKRKPTEKDVLKSIKHAEKVQIRHMSGIGALSSHIINDVKNAHTKLVQWQKTLITLQNTRKSLPASMKKFNSMDIKRVKDHIKEIKTHISQLKKQIK
jgi:hypothetical protein